MKAIAKFLLLCTAAFFFFLAAAPIFMGSGSEAHADPNNCSLPSGQCQAQTFSGSNLNLTDGGIIRGPLVVGGNESVGGNLTVTGSITGTITSRSGGLTANSTIILPTTLGRPDAGALLIVTEQGSNTVFSPQGSGSLILNSPPTGTGKVVVNQTVDLGGDFLDVIDSNSNIVFGVSRTAATYLRLGADLNSQPAQHMAGGTALTDGANVGQLDAGVSYCIATAAAGQSSGLATNSTIILPVTLGRTDAGSMGTMEIVNNTNDSIKFTPVNGYMINPTGTLNPGISGAVAIRNNSNLDTSLSVERPDGGLLISVTSDTFLSSLVGEFADPVNLRDVVSLGRLDAGSWGTIPGKASGLAANSHTGPGLQVDAVLYPDGGATNEVLQTWVGPSNTCSVTADGQFRCVGPNGQFFANTIVGGDFGTYPDFALEIAGTVEIYGSRPIIFNTSGFAPAASLVLGTGNFLMVGDGSSVTTGGVAAELIVKDATVSTHVPTLGQVKALEQTLFSVSPNAILVNAVPNGGHQIGTLPFTVTGISVFKYAAGVGSGNVVLRLTDGTNNCDTPIPCASTGVARGVATATTGTCVFPANAVITGPTPTGVTGTCTVLPSVLNADTIGHL